MPRYLNAMSILAAPSQTMPNTREQQGRMIIEAWACGVPVLGSSSGEIPEVIKDAGVVVPEKDEKVWPNSWPTCWRAPPAAPTWRHGAWRG